LFLRQKLHINDTVTNVTTISLITSVTLIHLQTKQRWHTSLVEIMTTSIIEEINISIDKETTYAALFSALLMNPRTKEHKEDSMVYR
jgi:hypothetical protein